MIASIDTPNASTAVVHLKKRFAPFVDTFFAESDQPYMIAPAHVLARYPNFNQVPFNNDPSVSDGPFKFVRVDARRSYLFETKRCVLLGQAAPRSDRRADRSRRRHVRQPACALTRSTICSRPRSRTTEALRNVPDIRIVWVNVNGYYYIQLNLARPDLSDPRVRLAIAYAIDKNELVRTLTYGTQTVATADIPNWMWAFNPNLHSYPHDPAEARAILRDAGLGAGRRRNHAKGRPRARARHGNEQLKCDAPKGSD